MKRTDYFIDSNGSKGYRSYYDSNFGGLEKTVVLAGFPPVVAEDMVKLLLKRAQAEELDVEIIHSCMDNSAEGIIIPKLKAGALCIPPYAKGLCCIKSIERGTRCRDAAEIMFPACKAFAHALEIHDRWEKIYLDNIDFTALDTIATDLVEQIIGINIFSKEGTSRDRFFGAATAFGVTDHVENIINGAKKRYFIKGRPGSGKSTILKKLAKRAIACGCDVDVYHCAFDPDSLDMLYMRELDVCIFDSTAPHEYFPSRDDDETVDVYEAAIRPNTDENNKEALAEIEHEYKVAISEAIRYVNGAYRCYESENRRCLENIDYKLLDKLKKDITNNIFS